MSKREDWVSNATYDGPERRRRGALSDALSDVRSLQEKVVELKNAVDDAVPRTEFDQEKEHHRTRVRMFLLIAAIVITQGGGNLYQNWRSGRVSDRIERVSTHIDDCLFPPIVSPPAPDSCFAKLAKRGLQGGVRIADYQACWAVVPDDKRTAQVMDACKRKTFPEAFEGGTK